VAGYSGATPGIQFPHPPPDVFTDFMTFLDCVACWIMERSSNAHTGLACEAVCGANRVWSGVGVYTVSELFFMAGTPYHILSAPHYPSDIAYNRIGGFRQSFKNGKAMCCFLCVCIIRL
jgi:hypothetical protein